TWMATDDTRGREAIAGGGRKGVIAATDGHGWPRMKPAGARRLREVAGRERFQPRMDMDGHG
ncbi:MAG: hypothetical protein ACK5BP_19510, partial [Planctomyces sp.]